MRQSVAALAVIRYNTASETLWLAQWNDSWSAFHFLGGHKYPGESFRDCVTRELVEETGLAPDQEFQVAERSFSRLEYIARSRSANEETAYILELFDVTLLNDTAQRKVKADSNNRWLSEREIRSKKCLNGLAISETMPLILDKAHLWTDGDNGNPLPFPVTEKPTDITVQP